MDFYGILGIGREASTAEIKRAYRRLSRQYHPGINPGDRHAASMFARISEAYETLVDPARRREYDNGARPAAPAASAAPDAAFTGFDFSAAAHGAAAATFTELFAEVLLPPVTRRAAQPEPGADLHSTVTISFAESLHGTERRLVLTRQVACETCGGTGVRRVPDARCTACQGRGVTRFARGHMTFQRPCAACAGTGRRQHETCGRCAGHGRVARSEPVTVAIAPGTPDGARLRLHALGHAGAAGGRPGDLDVLVRVTPHPVLGRDGDDIVCPVPIAVHEAVLGARIELPVLGERVKVTVPPGTQGGRRLRVRGRGFPTASGGRGDLVLEARLVLPAVVDERSRELIREFGRLNQGDVRNVLNGQLT